MNTKLNERQLDVFSEFFKVMSDKQTMQVTLNLLDGDKRYSDLLEITNGDFNKLDSRLKSLIDMKIILYKEKEEVFTLRDAHTYIIMREGREKAIFDTHYEKEQ